MASKLEAIPVTHPKIVSELIKCIEGSLGLETETRPHLVLKPYSEPGALLFMPRNRKLLEEKLIKLMSPQGEHPDCQPFNFSEKFQRELVTFLHSKIQHEFIYQYDLHYDHKICAIIVRVEINQLTQATFHELATEFRYHDTSIYGHVIINLQCIEEFVLDPDVTFVFKDFLLGKKVLDFSKAKSNPTIDLVRNSAISLALKNFIRMHSGPTKLIDSFDWRENRGEIKELVSTIYLACEKSGSLVKEEDTRIILGDRNEKLKTGEKYKEKQNNIEVLIKRRDATHSREVILAAIILFLMKTREVPDSDRVVFLFNQRMNEYLTRSLYLLYHIGFIGNEINLIAQFGAKQANSNPIAILGARREYLFQMLLERCEGAESGNCDEMTAKADELSQIITKFELLSHQTNHEVKLIDCDKVGTHHSMFVLYNYARIVQILNKFEQFTRTGTYPSLTELSKTDFSLLALDTEWNLFVNYVLKLPPLLCEDFVNPNTLQPNCISNICKFLISLSQDFSTYYSKTKILTQPGAHLYPRIFARIHLLTSLRIVMDLCFQVLDIKPLDQI